MGKRCYLFTLLLGTWIRKYRAVQVLSNHLLNDNADRKFKIYTVLLLFCCRLILLIYLRHFLGRVWVDLVVWMLVLEHVVVVLLLRVKIYGESWLLMLLKIHIVFWLAPVATFNKYIHLILKKLYVKQLFVHVG